MTFKIMATVVAVIIAAGRQLRVFGRSLRVASSKRLRCVWPGGHWAGVVRRDFPHGNSAGRTRYRGRSGCECAVRS